MQIRDREISIESGPSQRISPTGTCSVPNIHENHSRWVKATNGQAMNMRGLQLLGLEPPMILSWSQSDR